jgi:hypothetical protein
MKYEEILEEQGLRKKEEPKKRATLSRPRKEQIKPDQQKQKPEPIGFLVTAC